MTYLDSEAAMQCYNCIQYENTVRNQNFLMVIFTHPTRFENCSLLMNKVYAERSGSDVTHAIVTKG